MSPKKRLKRLKRLKREVERIKGKKKMANTGTKKPQVHNTAWDKHLEEHGKLNKTRPATPATPAKASDSPEPHPALTYAQSLMDAKSKDYGNLDHARQDYFPFGATSYMTMIHTKYARLMNLTRAEQEGKEANFESIQDSVVDLLNYAAFFWAYLEAQKKGPKDD